MPSPGAKSIPGWFRFSISFVRGYLLALAFLALGFLAADILWPGAGLAEGLAGLLAAAVSRPP